MMKFVLIVFYLTIFLNINAQQKITLHEVENTEKNAPIIKYLLPQKVTCTFSNNTKKTLILKEVKGDSLIFKKYYNQTQNYDCKFTDLYLIRFHNKNEKLNYFATYILLNLTYASIGSTLILSSYLFNEYGARNLRIGHFVLLGFSFGFGKATLSMKKHLPKTFETDDWMLSDK